MNNKKVLIVEDDNDVRLGYHVLLKASHYDTVLAQDGVSAVSEALNEFIMLGALEPLRPNPVPTAEPIKGRGVYEWA